MAVSVDWGTKVITVPKADTTLVSLGPPEVRSYSVDTFRLALKGLEDDADGMAFPDTHTHNTEITISGVVYARLVEIINGYTVTFEDGQYQVQLSGANHNLADVINANQVGILVQNSAGLQTVTTGSGLSAAQDTKLTEVHGELRSIEGGSHFSYWCRVMIAALAGKLSGAATTSVTIRDQADTKNRITATVDTDGNRTAVSVDGS